jgi:hypothetical protein
MAKRGTPMPEDFVLNNSRSDFAYQKGLGMVMGEEWEAFVDYHKMHGSTFCDWDAAWRTWIRNAIKFRGRNGQQFESFSERRERKNAAAINDFAQMVHGMEGHAAKPPDQQAPAGSLPGRTEKFKRSGTGWRMPRGYGEMPVLPAASEHHQIQPAGRNGADTSNVPGRAKANTK